MRVIYFLPLLLFCNISFSQHKTPEGNASSKDPRGWRNLTWESAEAAVKEKYAKQLTILPEPVKYGMKDQWYCPFEISNFILGYDTFRVSFLFDIATKKLVQVNVKKENPVSISKTVQDLEISLIEKYGNPNIKKEAPKYIAKWIFPDLSIELTFSDVRVGNVPISKTVFLVYRKPDKNKLDNF